MSGSKPPEDEEMARCCICGEPAQAECEECGDDLCTDDLPLHMEDHDEDA